tara:strand:- start:1095 stop:1385 length:291 start_codon:yes stop_codon:yes gene_type:complete
MSNKFAAALKSTKTPEVVATQATLEEAPSKSPHARPSRKSTKHVGGYFDPAVSKQLRQIALEEDSSVQALLGEAIDMLFQNRRKPMIASKPKKHDS